MPVKFYSPIIPNLSLVEHYLEESFQLGKLSDFGLLYDKLRIRLENIYSIPFIRPNIVLTSSGNTALMTAYAALGVKRVVIPAYCSQSVRAAALIQGIEVIELDVDRRTASFTVEQLTTLDVNSYDAIVVVCPLSSIPHISPIQEFCRVLGKKLIIDAASTFSSRLNEFGDAVCFSFNHKRILSAGEGGAILFNNYILVDKAKEFIDNSINAKLSEYSCGITLAILDIIGPFLAARKRNFEYYRAHLEKYFPYTCCDTVYEFLPLYFPTPDKAERVLNKLLENNFPAEKHYKPLNNFENSNHLYNTNVSVPIHQDVKYEDIQNICALIKGVK